MRLRGIFVGNRRDFVYTSMSVQKDMTQFETERTLASMFFTRDPIV